MQDGRPIRVVIVDEHPPARSRLGDLVRLHHQLRMVGEAENCEDALQLCQMLEPDVALLSLRSQRWSASPCYLPSASAGPTCALLSSIRIAPASARRNSCRQALPVTWVKAHRQMS